MRADGDTQIRCQMSLHDLDVFFDFPSPLNKLLISLVSCEEEEEEEEEEEVEEEEEEKEEERNLTIGVDKRPP